VLKAPLRWLRALHALAGRWLVVIKRLLADPLAPISALALILIISQFACVYDLSQPCTSPCQTPASHTLIFDESYYVNAARVITGVAPPPTETYGEGPLCSTVAIGTTCRAPFGDDPNAEHPQLAKLIIAGSIELFGDNPKGWRLPSVLFSLIALAALYGLVVALGGSGWLAVAATAVMALDNLMLVQGRIATQDIFGVAMMLISAMLYVRRWPLLAGVALGIGGCMKETSLYIAGVFVLLEAMRVLRALWVERSAKGWMQKNLRPAFTVVVSGAAIFLLVFWILDMLVPAYDPGTHITYAGSPFTHLFHIIHYAAGLKAVPNATGISSTPWEWLLDQRAINYASVAVDVKSGGMLIARFATISFQGEINPFIIFLAVPALFAALAQWWKENDRIALFGAAWVLATYLISVYDAQIAGRIAYLYYMTVVMPGIYLIVVRLFSRKGIPRSVVIAWSLMLVYSFLNLYPIRTLF
jgi:predicted membrane-bound dolichyl-phosphate-mannose-protein mannosyltransferase